MAPTPRKPVLVVTHERSGTHFLMNTLGLNFGYRPRTDLERGADFDPGSTPQMLDFLLRPRLPSTVVKSHHQAGFFPVLPRLAECFHLIYVVRDPRDALVSFWRYLADWGPEGDLAKEELGVFLRGAPRGFITSYQLRPLGSMVERWRVHAEGWLDALERLDGRATLVRYGDLDERFPSEVARLAEILDLPLPDEVRRPPLDEAVIHPGEGGSGRFREVFAPADLDFVRREAGETMRRLGYRPD